MRAAGREATVKIDAVIGKDGTVSFARVLNADIHPDFAIAAVDAVRQWKFSPTLLNGVPVDVAMVVSVAFNLGD
jgi:protein TonB